MNQAEKERLARVGRKFNAKKYIDEEIAAIRGAVGDKKVLLAMSGGVDSSVCAVLLNKAIGKQLVCARTQLQRYYICKAIASNFASLILPMVIN